MVWLITVYEIGGSLLLMAGKFTRWLAAGFILLLLTGIVIIHAAQGWFVASMVPAG